MKGAGVSLLNTGQARVRVWVKQSPIGGRRSESHFLTIPPNTVGSGDGKRTSLPIRGAQKALGHQSVRACPTEPDLRKWPGMKSAVVATAVSCSAGVEQSGVVVRVRCGLCVQEVISRSK